VEPSAPGAAAAWNGTMTATHTWNKLGGGVMHTGNATSTFTGVWQPDGPNAAPIFACSAAFSSAPPCVVHRPTGTIKWTWDSDWPADAYQPGCHNSSTGSLPAGSPSRPDTQSLVLLPNDKGQFQYWGLGTFLVDPQKCPEPINNGSNPPVYFDILEHASSQAPPDESGNTCFHTTWVIEASADAIVGSCDLFKYSYNSLHFEWNLTRVPAG
jgi:hypothetical protein